MSAVKGQTTIKYVKQGDCLTCSLRSTFPLKQYITNGNGIISPSFKTNQPCIYPVIRSSLKATRVSPLTTDYHWYYNGAEIVFNSGLSNVLGSIAAGTFKSEWKTIDGFSVPTLTILKELASPSNIDADTIEFKCIVNTGFSTMVSASTEVSIEQTDGEAVLAYVSINNGGVIDDDTSSLTATAHLLVGGTEKTVGVTYSWYKMIVTAGTDGWKSLNSNTPSINIAAADVNSSELYKCVITFGEKSASAVIEIVDETDALIIYPNPTNGSGASIPEELSSVQTSIIYRPKVMKRATEQEVSGYSFYYQLTNSAGETIKEQDGGSSFTVTLADAVQAGGDMTLIIAAE